MLTQFMLPFLVIGADLLEKAVFENYIHLANRSIEACPQVEQGKY